MHKLHNVVIAQIANHLKKFPKTFSVSNIEFAIVTHWTMSVYMYDACMYSMYFE